MTKSATVDPGFSALLHDYLQSEVFRPGTVERELARTVAQKGLRSLNPDERRIWEAKVLPVVSKPLRQQIAIASILRAGGYVPRKVVW